MLGGPLMFLGPHKLHHLNCLEKGKHTTLMLLWKTVSACGNGLVWELMSNVFPMIQ